MEVAGAHSLSLPYDSKCKNIHGHNWKISISISSPKLTEYGMVCDFCKEFAKIEEIIEKTFDHQNINDVLSSQEMPDGVITKNPTAEVMSWLIFLLADEILHDNECFISNDFITQHNNFIEQCFVSKVEVQESEGNVACYTP